MGGVMKGYHEGFGDKSHLYSSVALDYTWVPIKHLTF